MKPLSWVALAVLIAGTPLAGPPTQAWAQSAEKVSGASPGNPPNVLLIMTDDQGYGDVGFTGNDRLQTPHLDRLAQQSTLFMSYPDEKRLSDDDRVPAPYPGGMAVTSRYDGRHYKMVNADTLYNVSQDPEESNNIAGERPGVLKKLDRQYRAFWKDVRSDRSPYPRVHVGEWEDNPAHLTNHWARLSDDLWWEFSNDPPGYRGLGVHADWISRWPAKGGTATWRLTFAAADRYRVRLRVRCSTQDKESSGTNAPHVRVTVAGHHAEQTLSECPAQWTEQSVGVLRVPAGPHDLKVSVCADAARLDLDLGQVLVERLNGRFP